MFQPIILIKQLIYNYFVIVYTYRRILGWMFKLSLFFAIFSPFLIIGQSSNFGCETGSPGTSTYVPTFPIDLSASPSAIDTLDIDIPPGGFGECCGESNNINCFVMEITLNSLSAGISFQLDGASGNSDIWYEDCTNGGAGSPSSVGDVFCVSGVGPHYFTFCRPGSTDYGVIVQSVPAPGSTGDIAVTEGCIDTLAILGLDNSTITWTSILPGSEGDYNDYITDINGANPGTNGIDYTNADSILINPQPGFPASISYEVCGLTIDIGCGSPFLFCDTATVSIESDVVVTISPSQPVLCTVAGATLTAAGSGGQSPYEYLWTGPSSNGATTSTITATVAGEYIVQMTDSIDCSIAYDTVIVSGTPVWGSVDDQILCDNDFTVDADFTGSDPNNTYTWTNDNTSIGLVASGIGSTISSFQVTNSGPGIQVATITVTPELYGCIGPDSSFSITVNPLPIIDAGPDQIICNGAITQVNGSGGITYIWDNGVTDGVDFVASEGVYNVTGTDINGCTNTSSLTISFDEIPPTGTAPADYSVACIDEIPVIPDVSEIIDEADNHGTPTVTWVEDFSDGNSCPELYFRLFNITDSCGNQITVTQTIIVHDTIPPTASNLPDTLITCFDLIPPVDILDVTDEDDNCGTTTIAFVSDISDGLSCPETITRTYSVTDSCSNSITVTQNIIVHDTIPPTASNLPDTLITCFDLIPPVDILDVTDEDDNCGTTTIAFVSDISDGLSCPETITRTYSVTDSCSNSITVTQNIIVHDTIPPTASNLPDTLITCFDLIPPVDILDVTDEDDNCGTTTIAFVSDVSDGLSCPETITRTYSVTDSCSNSITVTQNIIVHDTIPPTASNLPDTLVTCFDLIPPVDILDVTDEDDNCGTTTIAFVSDISDGLSCPETITRTYSVTDSCSNSITVTQNIIVHDTIPPTASNLPDTLITCFDLIPPVDILDVTDEDDNCGTTTIAFVSDISDGLSCPETITRTYSVTDSCSNSITVTQNIIVHDTIPPTASNPSTTTVPGGPAPAVDITVVIDEADNCGVTTVTFVSESTDANPCPETIIRIYSITDSCGNSINVEHTILITDPILPTASNLPDTLVTCFDLIPPVDILDVTDETDNNGPPTVAFVSDVSDGLSCPETITRTYSVTDSCSNSITVTQNIIVHDTIPPTASNLPDTLVTCFDLIPPVDILDVTDEDDNCGTTTIAFVSDISDGLSCPETITRTYSVTDSCSNSITVTQNIIVHDTIPPTASNLPDTLITCFDLIPPVDILDVTDEDDNCGTTTIAFVSDISDGLSCPETITRTYSVTDSCSNSITVTQNIIVHDTIPPTAYNPSTTTVPGGPAPAVDITVVIDEADNCGVTTVTFVSESTDANPCPETIIRIYSITDSCGNSINVEHTILITDPILPTASNLPDTLVTCFDLIPPVDILDVTDETDNNGPPTVAFVSDVSDGLSCPETITRTYSVTDSCSNSITVTQNIIVHDTIPPTASNLPDTLVTCFDLIPPVDILDVTDEDDNCGTTTIAFVSDISDGLSCPETITRTYSVTDSCSNSITVTQNIIVHDTIPPTASNLPDTLITCFDLIPPVDILDVTDEDDNCGTTTIAFVSDISDGLSCPETITRTYSVTDSCSNSITVTQNIIVHDTIPPTASNLPDTLVTCFDLIPPVDILDVTDEDDNCGTTTIAFVSDISDGLSCPETITRTYSVTDSCSNSITVTQNIFVHDTIPPTASNPNTITTPGTAPPPDVTVVIDENDNCGIPIVAFVSETSDNGNCPETITRIYSITDSCGNSINVEHTILITDPILPTASNLPDTLVTCFDLIPPVDILDVTDETDNNGPPTVAFVSDVSDGLSCPETITRTYSVTDSCSNSITVTQNIFVHDTIPPTASNLPDTLITCFDLIPPVDILDVTDEDDNCGTTTIAFVSDISDGLSCPETITRTYSVTDSCSNSITVTQNIIVHDTIPPTASNLPDTLVTCFDLIPPVDILDVTDEDDNCGTTTIAFVSDISDGLSCPETITRTYSVTDSCSNSITVTQNIIVHDTIPPTASNLPDTLITCFDLIPPVDILDVTDEDDNCGTTTIAFVSDISDGLSCPETITRTYSVTDSCSNSITVTQNIFVHDTIPPTASNPSTTTVPGGPAPAVDITVVIDEADNCGVTTVTFVSESTDANPCPETIIRIYSITDSCGNSINVEHTILITDPILPTASNLPDTLVTCFDLIPPVDILDVTDETDNNGPPTVAFVSDVSDGLSCPETITRTYSVTDSCSNSITVTQNIFVHDTIPPTASNLPDTLITCFDLIPPVDILDVTDEDDNCGTTTIAFVSDISDGLSCPETITRTYSVTDSCSNSITVTQNIIVHDTIPPTASNLPDTLITCFDLIPPVDILDVTDEDDNCGTTTIAFVSDVSDGLSCPETITRTYSVTDSCSNSITVTQNIIVHDTIPPTASNLPDTLITCFDLIPPVDILDVTDEDDNCGTTTIAFVSDISDGLSCPETITRTYSVTDSCSNSITVTQNIFVHDTIPPTASNLPDTLITCFDLIPPVDILDVTDEDDNCGTTTIAFVSDVSDGLSCPETITRTYSVTDSCSNSITVTQNIFVHDTIPPTASNLPDTLITCFDLIPPVDILDVTDEDDNCGTTTIAFVSDISDGLSCPETITRTYSVTDSCSNSITVTQNIIVHDTIPPTASNLPDTLITCFDLIPPVDILDVTDEDDNCGTTTIAFVSDVSDGLSCPETITRTYSVTDSCSNSITVTQNIIVHDTIPPTASNLPDTLITCFDLIPPVDILDVTDEDDNCGTTTIAFVSDISDGLSCPETITRTYSVTDSCSNSITVTQNIFVHDTIPPTASNLPDTLITCFDLIPPVDILDVTDEDDNCGTTTIAFVSDISDGLSCPETITRTYSVTDSCSNSITVTQNIFVHDTIPPTASNLPDTLVTCFDLIPPVDILDVTDEDDNCGTTTIAFVSDISDGLSCPETITRTYSVTDSCSNSITVTQNIIVHDTIPPTASNLPDTLITCFDLIPPVDILDVTDEDDNCGTTTIAFVSDVSDGLSCPETITRTYSVTDSCSNSITVTQNIFVHDTIPPTASNLPDTLVTCFDLIPPVDILDVTDEDDNCGTTTIAFVSDISDGLSCPETITRTYSVTDSCSNSITVTQNIFVHDTIPPTASNPSTTTVPGGPAPAVDITVVIDEADNCGVTTVTFVSESTDANPCPETIIRIYSITDSCGNSINVEHTILITDPILPTASNLPDTLVTCFDLIPPVDILDVTDETDNNGPPTVAFVSDVSDGLSCPETITRTYSVTDSCSNSITVTQNIFVHDTIPPTASNLPDTLITCFDLIPPVDILDVTDEDDNCGTTTIAFVSDISDGLSCPETITRTYSVTDSCSNSITVTQNIIVHDTIPPTASNLPDTLVTCFDLIPPVDILDVTDEDDNCGTTTIAFVSDVSDGLSCPETITRTYSVTDSCSNSITVTQNIIVHDTIPPTASNLPDTLVTCFDLIPPVDILDVTDEDDNCGTTTIAFVSDISDGLSCPETITRTYSVTDSCSNSITVTQNIIVHDTIPPTASNLPDTLITCFDLIPPVDILDVTDEDDNCGTTTIAFVSDISDGLSCPETITRTYSVTDSCSNSITVTQNIIVHDTIPPTASNLPDTLITCFDLIPPVDILDVTDEDDNCGTTTIAFVSDISDGLSCPETITRTYSVTDSCSNSITVTQNIIVHDTIPPTASNLPDTLVTCFDLIPPVDILDVTDEDDNCGTTTIAFVSDISDGLSCPETITRTYSVTDSCSNSITVTQNIIVHDTIPPTASNLPDTLITCFDLIPPVDILDVTDEDDNCGTTTIAFVSDVSDGLSCPETITRTYSVTDSCSNSITVTQNIFVHDTIPPTASNLPDTLVTCFDLIPPVDILDVTDEDDNCGTTTIAFVSDISDGLSCPETITRTYSVTDSCSNSITVTQNIFVHDTIPPTASNLPDTLVTCFDLIPPVDILDVTDEDDNCGTTTIAFVSDISDGLSCPETITRTYSVTDSCSNSITVTQNIIVHDTIPPTASNLPDTLVTCFDLIPPVDILDVTDEDDNCGTTTIAFVSDISDGLSCPETITRTYSVTDSCSNSITVTQNIIVHDTIPPTASNLPDTLITCFDLIPPVDILDVTDEDDNCGTTTIAFVSDISDGLSCPETITRTYSVTDSCSNSITVTQNIFVHDTIPPTASNPNTITTPGTAPPPDVTVVIDENDNCGIPIVAFVSETSDNGNCPETITRIYSITDSCGNSINVQQIIFVSDPELPTASNPSPINVECIDDVPNPDISVVTDASDNYGPPIIAWESDVSDEESCPETIIRTYSVTDSCGNIITVQQTIIIEDITPPIASNLPPLQLECTDAIPDPNPEDVIDEFDNCGTPIVQFVSDISDNGNCPETITRTYSVTDSCGNSLNVTQIITINDITPPTASAPPDISLPTGPSSRSRYQFNY